MANVLTIVSYKIFPPKFGGQKGIANFYENLSRHENIFCITVRANNPKAAPYRIFNKLSDSRLRYINIFYFGLCRKIIRENNISHVIVEHPYYGWLALLLKRFCGIPLIVHSHNIEAERFKSTGKWWWKIMRRYEKYVHSHADFTFCKTENDRRYFINNYKVDKEKVAVITFGISWNQPPSPDERKKAREALLMKYSLPESTVLYLFNGALNYKPNLDAVKNIVENINPLFIKKNISYKIIICGKGLPPEMNNLKGYENANIIYAGFVEDIDLYFKGTDVFINAVTDGGGIKTKLVEALGFNLNAVSTINGAIGVDQDRCNGKLLLSSNGDWQSFSDNMI
ncbi:MAG TPA: glycosyltransferase family 4 protein, partial [Chitinophagaceae bacterium]|nr:glycosyltransferase family 4 protein [Chitinophagaceae bacterium]